MAIVIFIYLLVVFISVLLVDHAEEYHSSLEYLLGLVVACFAVLLLLTI